MNVIINIAWDYRDAWHRLEIENDVLYLLQIYLTLTLKKLILWFLRNDWERGLAIVEMVVHCTHVF